MAIVPPVKNTITLPEDWPGARSDFGLGSLLALVSIGSIPISVADT